MRMAAIKRFNAVLLISGVIVSSNSLANSVCERDFSTLRCSSGTVDTIDFRGFVDIDGTTVSKYVKVVGSIDAQKAELNHMQVQGDTHLDSTTATGLMEINGNVRANDSTIVGSANIVGFFHGKHVAFNSTTSVIGTIDCEACTFNNRATLIGSIKLSNTKFLGEIVLNSKKGQFYHSIMNDIAVKKPSDDQDQVIELRDGSIVNNITFESGTGLVVLFGDSKVKGSVQGGKIVKKSA